MRARRKAGVDPAYRASGGAGRTINSFNSELTKVETP